MTVQIKRHALRDFNRLGNGHIISQLDGCAVSGILDRIGKVGKSTAGDAELTFVVGAVGIALNIPNITIDRTTGDFRNIGIIDTVKIALTLSESTIVNG